MRRLLVAAVAALLLACTPNEDAEPSPAGTAASQPPEEPNTGQVSEPAAATPPAGGATAGTGTPQATGTPPPTAGAETEAGETPEPSEEVSAPATRAPSRVPDGPAGPPDS